MLLIAAELARLGVQPVARRVIAARAVSGFVNHDLSPGNHDLDSLDSEARAAALMITLHFGKIMQAIGKNPDPNRSTAFAIWTVRSALAAAASNAESSSSAH